MTQRFAFPALAIVLTALLAACGGGGSSAPETSQTVPPGTSSPPPTQPAAPAGILWHNDFSLDQRRGVQISPLDGAAPSQVTTSSDVDVSVWPDGKQYVITAPDIPRRTTAITVVDRATGNTVYQGQVNGYLRDVAPSPTDKRLARVRHGETTVSDFEEYVIDFSTMKPVYSISDSDWFSWLPDGRFMLIGLNTGSMRTGSLDGSAVTTVGQLKVPAERIMGQFLLSPTGKQLVVPLTLRGSATNETDLWIANADGTGLEQFTETKVLGGAVWSPDGGQLAYTTNTGIACGAGSCAGSCNQWVAPASLRKVQGLAGTQGSDSFNVSSRSGTKTKLGCSVLAWTP
jgi:Tol biopolymer transport system component